MKAAALSVICLATLVACAPTDDADGTLAHSQWQFLEIDGSPPPNESATISFEAKTINASAGCNTMSGAWRTEGERLIAGPLTQTEIYCEGPRWHQEKALGALLAAAPRFALEGDTLTLQSSGHSAELRRKY